MDKSTLSPSGGMKESSITCAILIGVVIAVLVFCAAVFAFGVLFYRQQIVSLAQTATPAPTATPVPPATVTPLPSPTPTVGPTSTSPAGGATPPAPQGGNQFSMIHNEQECTTGGLIGGWVYDAGGNGGGKDGALARLAGQAPNILLDLAQQLKARGIDISTLARSAGIDLGKLVGPSSGHATSEVPPSGE